MVESRAGLVATAANLREGQEHCVFRRAHSWFALPALAVREVLFRTEIVAVPFSGDCITGLCHLRSEFLAAINLNGLLPEETSGYGAERQMIVVNGPEGPWALLVDEVDGLSNLETTSLSAGTEGGEEPGVVIARAVRGANVVQVLDPDRLYYAAAQSVEPGAIACLRRTGDCESDDSLHNQRQTDALRASSATPADAGR
jgi:chemotaxis signal transduction protein